MKYKAAVIGCGRIGSTFDNDPKRKTISTHCGAYYNHPSIDIVAISDFDKFKLIECKKRWRIDNAYTDYKEMLAKNKIDILSVCTQADSHETIVEYAAKQNVKAIFCEKPISDNLSGAYKMLNECKKNNVLLFINHFRRWDDFHINIKEKIKKNSFGSIQHVNFYYTRGISNSGSHLFDLLRYYFGEIKSILTLSQIDEIHKDPTFSCTLEMEKGFICNLVGLDGRNYRIFDIEIFGSKSKIYIDLSKKINFYKSFPSRRSSEFNELYESDYNFTPSGSEPFLKSLDNIVNSLTNNEEIACDGNDGLKSLELILASHYSKKLKKKITLPFKKEKLIRLKIT